MGLWNSYETNKSWLIILVEITNQYIQYIISNTNTRLGDAVLQNRHAAFAVYVYFLVYIFTHVQT